MEEYPKTLAELERDFSTEEACGRYVFRLRWSDGSVCPRCGSTKAWTTKRGLSTCAGCKHQLSVKAGTIFAGSRAPLTMWFRAIWWVTSPKNGASAKGLQRILGLGSYETAWPWLHKLRRAMVRPGRDRLAGVVEVDETYIGGEKPGKRGRGAEGKALVLIHLGYVREIVRKDADVGDNLLPCCNRVASLLKRWLLGTHQGAVSHEHLDYYLDEYTFRFNRRTSRYRDKLFYRLIQQAVAIEPVPYSALVKHARGPKPKNHKI